MDQEDHRPSEWTLWEAGSRLLRSMLYIAFFLVLHHGLEWLLRWLGDSRTWLGIVLINGTGLAEVVGILAISGIEVYVGIALAAKGARHRLR